MNSANKAAFSTLSAYRNLRARLSWAFFVVVFCFPTLSFADAGTFTRALDQGPMYAAAIAFLGGLLVSLTPCVYPMIAITVSVFGARQATNRWQGLGLSSAFVAGIVAMFTPLGLVAGMTGSLFGAALQNQWVLVGIAALFLAMSASMLGAFELALPSSLTNRLARVGGVGPRGAFGLGLVCGLIAAPCTGPVLTGILTWIANTQSAFAGALAMLAFSLGLGVPFFFVGAFAVHLPKSGAWMVHVKSILGIVLCIVALYYLATAFPGLTQWVSRSAALLTVSGLAVLAGILLGAVHREFSAPGFKDPFLKGCGTFLATVGGFVLVTALTLPEQKLAWADLPFEQARTVALQAEQPLLVDFTASWCAACKELEKHTFAHPDVRREAGRFLAVQVDATDDEDPVVASTMASLQVVGLPTVLVFDSTGREVSRFTDFVDAEAFLAALRGAR